jgi:hypothetical protein
VTAENQKPTSPKKNPSAVLLIWAISGFYLLAMIGLLLFARDDGAVEPHPWIASAVSGLTLAYGVLMILLWRDEDTTAKWPRK